MFHLADLKQRLMSICFNMSAPDDVIKAINTTVINLADKGIVYENLIST